MEDGFSLAVFGQDFADLVRLREGGAANLETLDAKLHSMVDVLRKADSASSNVTLELAGAKQRSMRWAPHAPGP